MCPNETLEEARLLRRSRASNSISSASARKNDDFPCEIVSSALCFGGPPSSLLHAGGAAAGGHHLHALIRLWHGHHARSAAIAVRHRLACRARITSLGTGGSTDRDRLPIDRRGLLAATAAATCAKHQRSQRQQCHGSLHCTVVPSRGHSFHLFRRRPKLGGEGDAGGVAAKHDASIQPLPELW